jgi:hypothetical protein
LQKIPLGENLFLRAGKGAENTKEKSRQCFRCKERNQIIANLMFTCCDEVALNRLWSWTRLMLSPTTSRTFNTCPPENVYIINVFQPSEKCAFHFQKSIILSLSSGGELAWPLYAKGADFHALCKACKEVLYQ